MISRGFIKKGCMTMKIITISREFGSGGRELGKRLADVLGIPCYDHEIIDMVAKKHGFDKNYVAHVSKKDVRKFYPSTIGHRFLVLPQVTQPFIEVTVAQRNMIRQLAEGGDCVIVGRGADVILQDLNILKIFVYADKESKLARCRERVGESENISDKEILKNMRQIDKERIGHHKLIADTEWGSKEAYHLCINTSGKRIKELIPALAEYANCWF